MKLSITVAAREAPEREALVVGEEALSFSQLAGRVRVAVGWLRQRGVDAETPRVALVGEVEPRALTLFYALAELGVPVVMVHPGSPGAERRRLLAQTGTEILLEPAELPADLDAAAEPAVPMPPPPDGERCLAVVPTSGSAGRPKGVVLSRRAFVASAAASAANLGWRDGDRWLLSLPIAHIGGLSILTRCLIARRAVVVHRLPRFAAAEVARVIEARRVTLLSLVPTTLRRLLELQGWQPPAGLRAILVGGAAAPAALLRRAAERGWPVLATYGLTEACSQVATQRLGSAARSELGCGEPLPGLEVRIRGGVIELRGPTLMSATLPSPTTSPWTADGWLRTGDLGRLDAAGRLHVLGRRDAVIVSGGENVQPAAVEEALAAHPAIDAACVFGVEHPEWGEAVAAAVRGAPPPPDAELVAFLAERLAPHQRPRWLACLEEWPVTASGKADRARIRRLAAPHLRPLDGAR